MTKLTANRRAVLVAGLASLTALLLKAPRLAGAEAIRIRPNANTADGAAMLEVYAKAVTAMKAKPVYEPTSWWFQANTHWMPTRGTASDSNLGTQEPSALNAIFTAPAGSDQATRDHLAKLRKLALDSAAGATSPFGPNTVWRTCPHGFPSFLIWHRIYVVLFEQAVDHAAHEVGALPADKHFALPYWNYVVDAKLPEAFRLPGNTSNPLFIEARTSGANGGAEIVDDLALNGSGDPSDGGWTIANQQHVLLGDDGFSSILETAPHGSVHVRVGAGGLMGTTARAARDPIFWLHHAEIDRLWESWRKSGNGADPSDLTADGKDWNDAMFRFVSLDDEADVRQARNVLDADALGYRYDTLEQIPTTLAAAPMATSSASAAEPAPPIAAAASAVTVGEATVRVPLAPTQGVAASAEPVGQAGGELMLRLSDIRATVDPGTDYDVFVQPKDATGEPTGKPVARINLFGRVHEMTAAEGAAAAPAMPGITVSIPLAASLASAGMAQLSPADLVVTIRPNAKPEGDITIGKVELVIK